MAASAEGASSAVPASAEVVSSAEPAARTAEQQGSDEQVTSSDPVVAPAAPAESLANVMEQTAVAGGEPALAPARVVGRFHAGKASRGTMDSAEEVESSEAPAGRTEHQANVNEQTAVAGGEPELAPAAELVPDTTISVIPPKPDVPELPGKLRRVSVDSTSMQGRGAKQEDRHVKIPDLTKAAKAMKMPIDHLEQPCAFFAVYDGHQGHLCAEFSAKGFHGKLLKKLSAEQDSQAWTDERFSDMFREICEELDNEFMAKHRTASDGCTAVVALITGTRLHVAWVGHAQCMVAHNVGHGELAPLRLTEDHRPSLASEAKRVEEAGGVVVDYGDGYALVAHEGYEERVREIRRALSLGQGRIGKEPVALDVSRSLGNRQFKAVSGKALLVPTPGIQNFNLDCNHKFIALVCGGIPAMMQADDIIDELDMIRDETEVSADLRAGCGALVQEAYKRGSTENLTVIMVRLEWTGPADENYVRKVAIVEKARQAAAAAAAAAALLGTEPKKESAVAASKRRRQEAAASISNQKVAAYERAVSSGDAAAKNAAEDQKKEAQLASMQAEVAVEKVKVAKQAEETAKKEAAQDAAIEAERRKLQAEQGVGADAAADAFFAARRAKRKAQEETEAGESKAETPAQGLDAAEAFFAARKAKKESVDTKSTENQGLDAAEAFFAARKARKTIDESSTAAQQSQAATAQPAMDAAEDYFEAQRKKKAANKSQNGEEPAKVVAVAASEDDLTFL